MKDNEQLGGMVQTLLAVLGILGTIGGLGGVATLISARAIRKRTLAEAEKIDAEGRRSEADAAKVLTDAAITMVEPLKSELSRVSGSLELVTTRVNTLEADAHVQRLLLVDHSMWDHMALMRLSEAGIQMDPAPPLFPPAAPTAAPAAVARVEVTVDAPATATASVE